MTGSEAFGQSTMNDELRIRTLRVTAEFGDITQQEVDVVVNAANNRMRGGGGVDGAIHRAGGAAVLQDCIDRFPDGLATGDAGWTTAGDLPARWVIHTVGPNYAAGQRDGHLLESCYRRSLEVADELGARTIAFPLISAGIYGWPEDDAVRVAVQTIAASESKVEEVRIVAFSKLMFEKVNRELMALTRRGEERGTIAGESCSRGRRPRNR